MTHRIYCCRMLSNNCIEATFFDGTVKRFDMNAMIKTTGSGYEMLADSSIYKSGRSSTSGDEIRWDCNISISSDDLWANSVFIERIPIDNVAIRLAAALMIAREERLMTQSELAKKTGIDQSDISKIERGVANPSINTLEKIARGLGDAINFSLSHNPHVSITEPMMDEILPYVNPAKRQGDFTVSDLLEIPQDSYFRLELIDGVFYKISTPSIIHQDIIATLQFHIMSHIRLRKGLCKVFTDIGSTQSNDEISEKDYLIPDLMVVCDPSKLMTNYVTNGPDFVLEVVSKSTASRDKGIKVEKYRAFDVHEYWIIDPEKKRLTVYKYADEDNMVTILPLSGCVELSIFAEPLTINLDEISELIDEGLSRGRVP